MTSPCQNCHGAPTTQPDSLDNQVFALDASGHKSTETLIGELLPPPCQTQCSTQAYWPNALTAAKPELQTLPWWVRSNFESTREKRNRDQGEAHVPLRIKVHRGKVSFQVYPEPGEYALPKDAAFKVKPLGYISGQVEIKDNRIPLWEKGLLEFARTEFHSDYYPGYLLEPISVRVGNYGGLHFLSVPDSLVHFLMVPFMAPKIPVGRDFPTISQEREKGGGYDPEDYFLTYPDLKGDALDLDLEGIIGTISPSFLKKFRRHFHDKHDRLPQSYNLEKLVLDILELASEPAGPKKPPSKEIENLLRLSNLRPGKILDVDLESVEDLFISKVIDLGPSSLHAKVSLLPDRKWGVDFEEVDLHLDPMDYGSAPDGKRSNLQLHRGNIRSAKIQNDGEGYLWPPGIHLVYDPETNTAEVKTHLKIDLEGKIPGLGLVAMEATVTGQSTLDFSQGMPKLVPQKTFLKVSDFSLKLGKAKTPLIQNLNFSLNDLPRLQGAKTYDAIGLDQPALYWELETDVKKHQLQMSGAIRLPVDEDGAYDMKIFLESFLMEALGKLTTEEGKVFKGKLKYESLSPEGAPGSLHHMVSVDLGYQKSADSVEKILIKDGKLDLERRIYSESDEVVYLSMGAKEFYYRPIHLKDPEFNLQIDRFKEAKGVQTIRIPVFNVQANPKGNHWGIFKGILRLEQHGEKPLELSVHWTEDEKRLQLANMHLAFNLQQIDFKSLLPEKTLKAMNSEIDAVNMDGHLFGNFTLDFPKDFPDHRSQIRGWGDLLLRGDRQGDIYFVNDRGRMSGPALLRDTMWHWKRIHSVNFERGYALGDFNLDTIINPASFLHFFGQPLDSGTPGPEVYGVRGQRLKPYEISAEMYHNNQPWAVSGFKNRIVDYLVELCQEDAECAPNFQGGEFK